MRSLIVMVLGLALVAAWPGAAGAQDADADRLVEPAPPEPKSPESKDPTHTSASVADAPRPREANNRSVEPSRDGEWALWIPRILFFPLRVAGEVVSAPVLGGLYAYEKYNLGPRVKSIFFNEDGTVGVYPTALIETGFGLNVGGRLILRRIAGDVGLTARAGFGGRFRQIFSTKISTRDTFERVELDLEGLYEIRPHDRFFGIGNGELSDEVPAMPLDPRGDIQRESRFRQDALRVTAAASYKLNHLLSLRVSGAFIDRAFADAEGDDSEPEEQIVNNYDADQLTGFDDGNQQFYSELQLTYDSRRAASFWEGASTPSTGWLAQVYAGYTLGLSDDPARYVRYGADLQRYFRLADGPRTLAFRLYVEGVTGSYDEVSFHDLPRLGGPLLLRGFAQDRFRDRVASFGSAEYQFDASEILGGFVFADAGRVFANAGELELSGLQLGFGGGLEMHTKGTFLGRLTIASNVDGEIFVLASFDPVYDVRARVERK